MSEPLSSALNTSKNSVCNWMDSLIEVYWDWEDFAARAHATESHSSEFLSRCEEAGHAAMVVLQYRSYALSEGFAPISFKQYLTRLESRSGIPFGSVLKHFGIAQIVHLDRESTRGVGKLWRALGFSLREVQAALRITLLALNHQSVARETRLRGSPGIRSLAEICEEQIREVESTVDAGYWEQLRILEIECRHAYENYDE